MRIKTLAIVYLISLFGILHSCTRNEENFVIRGKLANGIGKKVYFQNFIGSKINTLDSAIIGENSEFEIRYSSPKLDFYQLSISPQNKLILILDSLDEPYIEGDAENLYKSYAVTGSQQSEILLKYFRDADKFETERLSLAKAYKSKNTQTDTTALFDLQNKIFSFNKRYYEYITNFADNNASSLAALSAIEKLNIQHDLIFYKKVYDSLKKQIPNSDHLTNLARKIEAAEKNAALAEQGKIRQQKIASILAIGNEAPNITLNSAEGKAISLNSLKGKTVLIDFWASWCGPCRKENPNVKRVYQQYHSKGFEIFAVSLDSDMNKWKQAIQKDGLPWVHVSDLAGWKSAAALKYGVESIPYTVLIDKQGKILAKNLRGKSLEQKLKELFPS